MFSWRYVMDTFILKNLFVAKFQACIWMQRADCRYYSLAFPWTAYLL